MKTVERIVKIIWAMSLIVGIIMLLAGIGQRNNQAQAIGLCMILWGVGLLLVSLLWKYDKCPYCGHFFTMKRISDKMVADKSTRSVLRNVEEYHAGMAYDLYGNSAFVIGKSSHKENGTRTTTRYVYNQRCSCCGAVVKRDSYSFESN